MEVAAAIPWAMYLPELQCIIREYADCLARAHLAMTCREEHKNRTVKFTTTLSGPRSVESYIFNGIVVHGSDAMLRRAFEVAHDPLLLFKKAIHVGRETHALEWLRRAAPLGVRLDLRYDIELLHDFATQQLATTFIDIVAKDEKEVVARMKSLSGFYWDAINDTTKEKSIALLAIRDEVPRVNRRSLLKWYVAHADVDVLRTLRHMNSLFGLDTAPSLSLLNALGPLGCGLRGQHGPLLPRWPLLQTQWIVQHTSAKGRPRLDWHNPDITVVGWLATHVQLDLAQDWHELVNENGFGRSLRLACSPAAHWIRLIQRYALKWPRCLLLMAINDCDIGAIAWLLDHTMHIVEPIVDVLQRNIGAIFSKSYAIQWLLETKRLRLYSIMDTKIAQFFDIRNDKAVKIFATLK